jgi:hypothetical protein
MDNLTGVDIVVTVRNEVFLQSLHLFLPQSPSHMCVHQSVADFFNWPLNQ